MSAPVMEIGVHLPTTQPAAVTREALVTFAQAAERHGFASLWASDHVVIPTSSAGYPGGARFPHPPERPYLEPVTVLSAVAVVTSRARLGCSVFILGHRHPVVMAKMLASIDALSGGRLIVGAGVGWWREELEMLGTPFATRGRQADEALRVFKALWTEDAPAFDGEFFHVRDVGFAPKPIQRPHPPIWIGGGTPAAFRRVVAYGDGWHAMSRSPKELGEMLARLRETADAAKRSFASIHISLRFNLEEDFLARGTVAVIDRMCEYKRLGVKHLLLVFRREDHGRMLEILDLVAKDIRPAVDACAA